ncbi:MAG: DNA-directed RNA polymerase subunit omega [Peptococcaceae bacterium]|jgi:DNA-directed RNA polymerase subunit omega|nr:DNA-directed RNA polymerase subunit omega [Peptococcaceae bacterium]
MKQPPIDTLMEKLDSKYALVVAAAKRARILTGGKESLIKNLPPDVRKPVSVALEEIMEDKIDIEMPKGGIK